MDRVTSGSFMCVRCHAWRDEMIEMMNDCERSKKCKKRSRRWQRSCFLLPLNGVDRPGFLMTEVIAQSVEDVTRYHWTPEER